MSGLSRKGNLQMGKTIRYGAGSGESYKKHSKKFPELISPRVFYNKLDTKWPRSKKLAEKRRTTHK